MFYRRFIGIKCFVFSFLKKKKNETNLKYARVLCIICIVHIDPYTHTHVEMISIILQSRAHACKTRTHSTITAAFDSMLLLLFCRFADWFFVASLKEFELLLL